jgi:hypothetical protein
MSSYTDFLAVLLGFFIESGQASFYSIPEVRLYMKRHAYDHLKLFLEMVDAQDLDPSFSFEFLGELFLSMRQVYNHPEWQEMISLYIDGLNRYMAERSGLSSAIKTSA